MGLHRGKLLTCAIVAAMSVGGAVASAQASAGSTPSKYYAVYKLHGSFSEVFSGMTCCNYSQSEKGTWTYGERFGPFSITRSTAHVKRSTPAYGGKWFYAQRSSAGGTTCNTSGKWILLGSPPTMKSTAHRSGGSGRVAMVLTAGLDPLGNAYSNGSCAGISFFGGCSSYIGGALAHTRTSNCQTAKYFTTDLTVSDSGLKSHHYVYQVSNTRTGSERVSPDCNQAGAPYACSYSWSGTVTFKPAG